MGLLFTIFIGFALLAMGLFAYGLSRAIAKDEPAYRQALKLRRESLQIESIQPLSAEPPLAKAADEKISRSPRGEVSQPVPPIGPYSTFGHPLASTATTSFAAEMAKSATASYQDYVAGKGYTPMRSAHFESDMYLIDPMQAGSRRSVISPEMLASGVVILKGQGLHVDEPKDFIAHQLQEAATKAFRAHVRYMGTHVIVDPYRFMGSGREPEEPRPKIVVQESSRKKTS